MISRHVSTTIYTYDNSSIGLLVV